MYVRIGQHLTRPAETVHGKRGDFLMLRFGETVDFRLARVIELLLVDLTTYEAAKAQWLKAPLTYDEAAMLLGCGRRFLARRVNDDPTFPYSEVGSRKVFLGHHIEEIQQRFERGELRYAKKGGRPWCGPIT